VLDLLDLVPGVVIMGGGGAEVLKLLGRAAWRRFADVDRRMAEAHERAGRRVDFIAGFPATAARSKESMRVLVWLCQRGRVQMRWRRPQAPVRDAAHAGGGEPLLGQLLPLQLATPNPSCYIYTHMKAIDLPMDAIDDIFTQLLGDLPSLRACALTCRTWAEPARSLLFRRLAMSSGQAWYHPLVLHYIVPYARSLYFNNEITGRPISIPFHVLLVELAPHLSNRFHQIEISNSQLSFWNQTQQEYTEEEIQLIDIARRRVTSLKLVNCKVFGGSAFIDFLRSFPNMRHLDCRQMGIGVPITRDDIFSSIELDSLSWSCLEDDLHGVRHRVRPWVMSCISASPTINSLRKLMIDINDLYTAGMLKVILSHITVLEDLRVKIRNMSAIGEFPMPMCRYVPV
jgi:hypothetical protein